MVQIEAESHQGDAKKRRDFWVDAVSDNARNWRDQTLEDTDRQKEQAGLESRIAERVLKVKREKKCTAEHAQAENIKSQVANAKVEILEQRQVDERMFNGELGDEKNDQTQCRYRKTGEDIS